MQPAVQTPFHKLEVRELAKALASNVSRGLSQTEAESRLTIYGRNQLTEKRPPAWWLTLLAQFNDLVIWILLAATALSAILSDWLEAAAIFAIVVLNGLLGFFQERKAERALQSLKKLAAPTAKVIRDGLRQNVPAHLLVPGDLVELEAGDHVPADLRLTKTFGLKMQEAALTGESLTIEKDESASLSSDAVIADRTNMVFLGTNAVAGKALGIVVATAMNTELGRIAGFLQVEKTEPTPLQKRLTELGRVLIFACLSLVAVIFVLQLLRGEHLAQTLLVAISLAVAAVPEGLPAVVTVALAVGLQRMVRRNALIRRLASVETLGCVTVICSDKTGTLTRNEMTVTEIVTGAQHYRVSGSGYTPEGEFVRLTDKTTITPDTEPADPRIDPDLISALTIGLWCNNARLEPPSGNEKRWTVFGDPTEGALLVVAGKAKLQPDPETTAIDEIPFDSERKLMSVLVREPDGTTFMYTKGAPESLLERCQFERRLGSTQPLSAQRRREILDQSRTMAKHALRLLGVASREVTQNATDREEADLIFAGIFGMIDPPREEARAAVGKCQSAGIRPVVITGDHPATGIAVARELNIAKEDDHAITGAELDKLSDAELSGMIDDVSVYARVSPEHKLRVVKTLKANGQVVAMTGDGVNDAPAVKMADIGIAMGITGTDVTKDASDMVLTDDNFASIINAVEEGRGIYDNIQEFVHYLLSCNASEIALVLFAALAGWPVPLLPIQILWMNLVTDGLPALALAMEKPEPNVMNRPPRAPNEAFFNGFRGRQILIHGTLMAVVAIAGFAYAYFTRDAASAQAMAFYIATFSQLFFSFACRSHRYTLPQLGVFSNPYLLTAILLSGLLQLSLFWFPLTRHVFFASPPRFGLDWIVLFVLALIPVSAVELAKIARTIADRPTEAGQPSK